MATEIELNGGRYVIGKLSAMQQFHVSRRIAPIIPPMIPVLLQFYEEMDKTEKASADEKQGVLALVNSVAPVLQPFADALAGLKDEDAEYVFGTCLSVVERWQGAGWAKVWNIAHKTSMFDDIGIDVMLPLVVRVVVANLGPFISGLLTSQASSPAAT
ncbi:phage tail assembly chaperone [Burkholderia cenocepacia]|uniref:phage tail assembly chaperone n=1 Tax=Burkholderia cenocepacia TaxID=95486 RepID=UPI00097CAFB8|nr:hypothetical protein [Burkholderia cenocepacia]AQQ20254.1 hypothetical protein A8D61_18160 [Burkholderia cenocepacia]ONJ20009.1 hypothetical protein A8D82_14095 [Burkholderia cenocepacia]ONN96072.1 hypothetical protein A8D64_00465 [Burkholderia cenocepacia]ONO00521.1 hypothetical protein A8D62_00180 [Burkholderia cenocepacia]ONO10614.1 hypothetical protein A8D70_21085 [Burkholderia cenocepacia]